jgi:chromosome segregation and condensation protein ScpB
MKTLAIGVALSQASMDLLLEAGLIQPTGQKEAAGRPALWTVTPTFLAHFGLRSDDEAYRRRILVQLNRGEGRHQLARIVFHGKRGELRQRYREGQED